MATSISAEITDSYYVVLSQYFEDYYHKIPSETEELTIREAAQLCKLKNSEDDYCNIYSRIHGISFDQAKDEPAHFEKFKEFVTARMNTGPPYKSGVPKQSNVNVTERSKNLWGLSYLSNYSKIRRSNPDYNRLEFTHLEQGQGEGITRKPQYSYCTQEEMDRAQSKDGEHVNVNVTVDNDNDSESTLKAYDEESDKRVVTPDEKNVETAALPCNTTTTTTTTATSSPNREMWRAGLCRLPCREIDELNKVKHFTKQSKLTIFV